MYGSDVGALRFLASADRDLWTARRAKSGDQGKPWRTATTIFCSAYANYFGFYGTAGDVLESDMAMDNVRIGLAVKKKKKKLDWLYYGATSEIGRLYLSIRGQFRQCRAPKKTMAPFLYDPRH